MPKTTPADFAEFSEHVMRWQKQLGLLDWHISLYHRKRDSALATTNANCEGRIATIVLATNWPNDPPQSTSLATVALHEVLHVLLAELTWLAECRFLTQGEVNVAEHAAIRRLEKVLANA